MRISGLPLLFGPQAGGSPPGNLADLAERVEAGTATLDALGGRQFLWQKYNWFRASVLLATARPAGQARPPTEPTPQVVANRDDLLLLLRRRSHRNWARQPVARPALDRLTTILRAQLRQHPHLTAHYLVHNVVGLDRGVYEVGGDKGLRYVAPFRELELCRAAQGQFWVSGSGLVVVLGVDWTVLGGTRGSSAAAYLDLLRDLGRVGQHVTVGAYLEGLKGWMTPAVAESAFSELLALRPDQEALYILKFGLPAEHRLRYRRAALKRARRG